MFAILPWMCEGVCCKERVDERSIVGAMRELPKIVQSGLRRMSTETSGEHPDPNLLAAFAEQTLLERERTAVTAHLALCAECRESLALAFATPEIEVAATEDRAVELRRHWIYGWRWVAPAAAACCVVAVALQYHVWPLAPEEERPTAAVIVSSKTASPAPENAQTQLANKIEPTRKLKVERHSIKPAEQLEAVKKMNTVQQDSLSERMPEAANDAATVSPSTIKENPPSISIDSAQQDSAVKLVPQAALQANAFRNDPVEAVPAQGASALIGRPRPAPSAKVGQAFEKSRRMAAPAPLASAAALEKLSVPPDVIWSINASPDTLGNSHGMVQRSADRGKTWESVPLSDSVSFRAVVATGSDVWAGGSDSALFHSSDGGMHWVQVTVSSPSAKLAGTIVSIRAENRNRLRITTRSGEAWGSFDGGRHWERE